MTKKIKNTGKLENLISDSLKTEDDIRDWLTVSLEEYLEDNDFSAFYHSLEYAIKAKDSISGISKKTGISRSNLYAIFKGEVQPQMSTVMKILK
ncbi:MAG TPA: hypothetical protein PLG15_02790, partial [Candidatus Gastranaerophilaceae bacterium]|nr:hypothetical protein [Candidatus Gastranaerophilaceae bacterium]